MKRIKKKKLQCILASNKVIRVLKQRNTYTTVDKMIVLCNCVRFRAKLAKKHQQFCENAETAMRGQMRKCTKTQNN